jgi:hypothetical protein
VWTGVLSFSYFFKNTSDTAQQVSGHQEWEGNKPGMALHPCPYLDILSSSMCCLLAGWCINNVFFLLFSGQFCNAPMRLPAAHHLSAESDTTAFCPPRRKLITTTTSLLYQRTTSSQPMGTYLAHHWLVFRNCCGGQKEYQYGVGI